MIMDEINYSIFGNQAKREKAERSLGMEDKRCGNCAYGTLGIAKYPCSECLKQYDLELGNLNFWRAEKVNKNYVKEFMDDNNLKIGKNFTIVDNRIVADPFISPCYHFHQNYELFNINDCPCRYELWTLLTGVASVAIQPFSPTNLPEQNETIWYVAATGIESLSFNLNLAMLYALVASGNAFRTKEEAELAAPKVRKEQGMINE